MLQNQSMNVTTFNSAQFGNLRTHLSESSKVWFCLSDVAKSLGIEQVSRLKSRLKADGVTTIKGVSLTTNQHGTTTKQVVDLNFIDEPNLYRCIFQSRKEEAEQFQNWVFEEVLPSIRKTGGYIATIQEDTPELIMARALQVAQATIEKHNARISQLETENAEKSKAIEQAEEQVVQLSDTVASMKPKVDYCDIILQSKETVATTQIAQDYGMTAKAFNVLLRNFGIQHKIAGQWILYAPYLPLGYVQSESIPITHTDGRKTTKLFSKWTQKGRLFLYEELKKHNVLPLIERKEEVA